MTVAAKRRPRGRPRVQDAARKRNNVTIRMRDALKSKIEQSADAQQRSISQEIETRLERSFVEERGFGGPRLTQFAYLMASTFALNGQQHSAGVTDESWLDNEHAFRAAVTGVIDALLGNRPPEDAYYVLQALRGRVETRKAMEKNK